MLSSNGQIHYQIGTKTHNSNVYAVIKILNDDNSISKIKKYTHMCAMEGCKDPFVKLSMQKKTEVCVPQEQQIMC